MFFRSNNLHLSKNHQLHPITKEAYRFYLGVRGLFCVQRTSLLQPHFLQVLVDICKHFGTLIIVLAWNFDDGYRQCYVFDNIFLC